MVGVVACEVECRAEDAVLICLLLLDSGNLGVAAGRLVTEGAQAMFRCAPCCAVYGGRHVIRIQGLGLTKDMRLDCGSWLDDVLCIRNTIGCGRSISRQRLVKWCVIFDAISNKAAFRSSTMRRL